MLDILAAHPSTARFIARKLAIRFVSDDPPAALVDRAAARFTTTKGDLREVVRTIITSPEFFAPEANRAKVKTPFEFIASALRTTGAEVRNALPLARELREQGMPLYFCQPPTGYDDTASTWVSSGALVSRMNFAVKLGENSLPGVRVPNPETTMAVTIGSPEFQHDDVQVRGARFHGSPGSTESYDIRRVFLKSGAWRWSRSASRRRSWRGPPRPPARGRSCSSRCSSAAPSTA